jgi:fructose-bisphosphate aldolase class II
MGVQDVLTRKTGVIVGDDVLRLFEYARENQFAIPAIVRQTEIHDEKR